MLAELFDKIREFSGHKVISYNGRGYSPSPMHEIKPQVDTVDEQDRINIFSLEGLVAGVRRLQKEEKINDNLFVVIDGPGSVSVLGGLNERCKRNCYLHSSFPGQARLGQYMDSAQFMAWLQYGFVKTAVRDALLDLMGRIKMESSEEIVDSGVSQSVIAKQGIVDFDWEEVPNPVQLRPFRTFPEVEQPVSDFVLRLEKGFRFALFSADGDLWKVKARENIAKFLMEKLDDVTILK